MPNPPLTAAAAAAAQPPAPPPVANDPLGDLIAQQAQRPGPLDAPPPMVATAPIPADTTRPGGRATSTQTDRIIIVALDPGHGGEDPGAIGPAGTRAKDVVLRVAHLQSKDQHVQRALLDMSTTAQINDSLKLGAVLLGEIGGMAKLHKPRVEQAGFAVLKAPDIPSVLVETAFISNPEEEKRLRSPAYQVQLADALMRGITRYFAKNPPLARSRSV